MCKLVKDVAHRLNLLKIANVILSISKRKIILKKIQEKCLLLIVKLTIKKI